MSRRPDPLLFETLTEDLSAPVETRRRLAKLSEIMTRDALESDRVRRQDVMPLEEELELRHVLDESVAIHDLARWRPRRFGGRVNIFPASVTYDGSRYLIRGYGGREFVVYGPEPHGDLKASRGATVSLKAGAHPAGLSVYYPIHPPFSKLIPQTFVLELAMDRLMEGGAAAGVDGLSPENIRNESGFIRSVQKMFESGHVYPKPLRQHLIPKGDGRFRSLAIPSVRDRLIQSAIFEVVNPYVDRSFLPSSYGFRPGHGSVEAVREFREYLNAGFRWVVLIDLKDFFDTVPFPLLRRVLKKDMHGDWTTVRWILEQAMARVQTVDGAIIDRDKGVPQGGVISPMLANMILHRFDVWARDKNYRMVRFADDISLVARKKSGAEKILAQSAEFLEGELGLVVNRRKSGIYDAHTQTVTVLGFDLDRGVVKPSRKNIEQCKASLLEILQMSGSQEERMEQFFRTARSWGQYFSRSYFKETAAELEKWTTEVLSGLEHKP